MIRWAVSQAARDSLVEALADLPYLAMGALSLIAVWRWPSFVRKLHAACTVICECEVAHEHAVCTTWRKACQDNLLATVKDVPYFVMGTLSLLALWRLPGFVKQLSVAGSSAERRAVAQDNLVDALNDVPYSAMGLLSLVAVWRLLGFSRKLCSSCDAAARREAAQQNLVEGLTDIPYILMGTLSFLAVWRLPSFLQKNLADGLSAADRREAAHENFSESLNDLPYVAMAVLSLVAVWRWPSFGRKLSVTSAAVERRAVVFENLSESLRDVPYVAMGALSFVAVWRLPSFAAKLRAAATAVDRREAAQHNFHEGTPQRVVVAKHMSSRRCFISSHSFSKTGTLDMPFVLLALLSCFALWRWLPAARSLCLADDATRRRKAFELFVLAVADIAAPIAAALVLLTLWRAQPLIRIMQAKRAQSDRNKAITAASKSKSSVNEDELELRKTILELPGPERSAATQSSATGTTKRGQPNLAAHIDMVAELHAELWLHLLVFHEAAKLIVESPYVVLQLLPLWRIPGMWRAVSSAQSDSQRRRLCREHCVLALADAVCLIAALIVICTLWCARPMVRELRAITDASESSQAQDSHAAWRTDRFVRHRLVLRWLCLFVCDIPFIALLALSCVMPWRIPVVLDLVRKMEAESFARKIKSSSKLAAHAALDIPCALLCLVLLLTWRTRCAQKIIRATYCQRSELHRPVLRLVLSFVLDLPFVLLSPLSMWRLALLLWRAAHDLERTAAENRRIVVKSVLLMLLDVVSAAAFLLVALVPWRTVSAIIAAVAALKESIATDDSSASAAVVELQSVKVLLPTDSDNHGLCFELSGKKPEYFTFSNAALYLEGAIWDTLTRALGGAAVGAAKFALHPVALCPQFLEASEVKSGTTDFKVRLQLACGYRGGPRLSHPRLHRKVDSLLAVDDCSVAVRINFAGGPAPARNGVLCRFKFKLSDIRQQTLLDGSGLDQAIEPKSADEPPCEFHVGALKCFTQAATQLPVELAALSLSLLPPLLRWPRVLSVLFGVGPWAVAAEQRSAVLWSDGVGNARDVGAFAAFVVSALPPWNLLAALRSGVAAARAGYSSGTGREFHEAGSDALRWAAIRLPSELLALVTAALPPFFNFGPTVSLLLQGWASPTSCLRDAHLRNTRLRNLRRLAGQSLLSCFCLVPALLISLSMWRLPTLLHRMRKEVRKHCSATKAGTVLTHEDLHRELIRSVFDVYKLLIVDGLQILEVVFILGTLVHAPALLARICALAKRRLHQYRKSVSRPRTASSTQPPNSSQLSKFDRMPERLLTDNIMPHLAASDLCTVAETCHRLHEISARNQYWVPLFRATFGRLQFNQMPAALDTDGTGAKQLYAEETQKSRRCGKTLEELDDEQGLRFAIHDEFLHTIESGDLWHLPLVPCKLAGVVTIPIHALLRLRYRLFCFEWAKDNIVLRSLVDSDKYLRPCRTRHPAVTWPINFWGMDAFLLRTVCLGARTIIGTLAICIALLNATVFIVCTLGLPLWLQLPRASKAVADVLAGAFLPLFVALQIFIALLPTAAASWWSWQFAIDFAATSAAQLSTVLSHAFSTSLQYGVLHASSLGGMLHWVAERTVYPYLSYLFPFLGPLLSSLQHQALANAATLVGAVSSSMANAGWSSFDIRLLFPLLHLELGRMHSLLYCFVRPLEILLNIELALLQRCHQLMLGTPLSYLSSAIMVLVDACSGDNKLLLIQFVWLITLYKALRYTWQLLEHCFPGVRPLELYMMPLHLATRIMTLKLKLLRLWLHNVRESFLWTIGLYSRILAFTTRFLRKFGVLGDLALTPLALAWMLWPLHVPMYLSHHHLFITAVPFTIFLCGYGKHIIEINWI